MTCCYLSWQTLPALSALAPETSQVNIALQHTSCTCVCMLLLLSVYPSVHCMSVSVCVIRVHHKAVDCSYSFLPVLFYVIFPYPDAGTTVKFSTAGLIVCTVASSTALQQFSNNRFTEMSCTLVTTVSSKYNGHMHPVACRGGQELTHFSEHGD